MIQLNIDCEGPITQNDNAFELCREFIPDGDRFFAIVSKYDDFLADVEKRPGYKAGDTLKLVLPFLKAYGVTDDLMERFSRQTLLMLPGTELMLPEVSRMLPSFIISTSYRPYLDALCSVTGFPRENVYCTDVSLDKYDLSGKEAHYLEKKALEIAGMEMIHWPDDAGHIEDVPEGHRRTIERLDEIFWHDIADMNIGRIFQEVNPIGGIEKAKAVSNSLERTGLGLADVIYAGDSITDVQALELVKSGGGTAVSFNGNRYALKSAKWAVLSTSTLVIAGLCKLLKKMGNNFLETLSVDSAGQLDPVFLLEQMKEAGLSDEMARGLDELRDRRNFSMFSVEESDMEVLIEQSEKMRKSVRGHGVGDLG
ncbi:MAG: hypothetical protein DSZ23_04565 [Thermodesulfatator sp.]|nr:MAG: hypothetical protein DSZ23_04565 [Thermodesulfatator sp.]